MAKIVTSIGREGLGGYLGRLRDRGEYRRIWRKVFYARRLRSSEVTVSQYRFALPQRTAGIKEELLLFGTHEPFATHLYRKFLTHGDIIFDVGSNLGYFVMVADQALNGQCEVHGFEPDPELFHLLRINSRQFRAKIFLQPCAATDRNGTIRFHRSTVSNWGTIVPRESLMLTETVIVGGLRLDEYAQSCGIMPTVLRMDIEGGEHLALRGSAGILPYVRLIFLELHCLFLDDDQMTELFALLFNTGFRRAVWSNRYYDWPWSRKEAQYRSLLEGTLDALEDFARRREYSTLSAFIFAERQTAARDSDLTRAR